MSNKKRVGPEIRKIGRQFVPDIYFDLLSGLAEIPRAGGGTNEIEDQLACR